MAPDTHSERPAAVRQGQPWAGLLSVQALSGENAPTPTAILVHHLSRRGLLIETSAEVRRGQTVTIGLAGVGSLPVRLGERTGDLIACDFLQPLSEQQWVAIGGDDRLNHMAPGGAWPTRVRVLVAIASAAALWGVLTWLIL